MCPRLPTIGWEGGGGGSWLLFDDVTTPWATEGVWEGGLGLHTCIIYGSYGTVALKFRGLTTSTKIHCLPSVFSGRGRERGWVEIERLGWQHTCVRFKNEVYPFLYSAC